MFHQLVKYYEAYERVVEVENTVSWDFVGNKCRGIMMVGCMLGSICFSA